MLCWVHPTRASDVWYRVSSIGQWKRQWFRWTRLQSCWSRDDRDHRRGYSKPLSWTEERTQTMRSERQEDIVCVVFHSILSTNSLAVDSPIWMKLCSVFFNSFYRCFFLLLLMSLTRNRFLASVNFPNCPESSAYFFYRQQLEFPLPHWCGHFAASIVANRVNFW